MRKSLPGVALLLAACGGSGGGGTTAGAPAPSGTSAEAVQTFLRAARDSNLVLMADLWGTSRGSARATNTPSDYQKRMVVFQAYLRSDSARVLSVVPVPGDPTREAVTVTLFRGGCQRQVPLVTVRVRESAWIVNNVDIAAAGNPARPCEPGAEPPG